MKVGLASIGGAAALLTLITAAAQHHPRYVHVPGQVVVGALNGDARSGCTWLESPTRPIEVQWPADVTVRFSPDVELVRHGQIVARTGTLLAPHVRDATSPSKGCAGVVVAAVVGDEPQADPAYAHRLHTAGDIPGTPTFNRPTPETGRP